MRGGKSFLVLVVVAAAIAAYVYFVESKRDPAESADTVKHEKIWTLDSAKVEELELKAAGGDVTKLKKNGAVWQITSPEPGEADQEAVGTVLSAISSLESPKVVDENAASLAGFELEPARIRVSAKLAGETAAKQLDLGTKTPTGADLYARIDGQKKVFLVGGSLEDQLNRTTFDLRDKTVLKFDREKADSLKVEPGTARRCRSSRRAPKNGGWRRRWTRADFGVIDGIISKLSQARIKAITTADGTKDRRNTGSTSHRLSSRWARGRHARRSRWARRRLTGRSTPGISRPLVFTVERRCSTTSTRRPPIPGRRCCSSFGRSRPSVPISRTAPRRSRSRSRRRPRGVSGPKRRRRGNLEADEAVRQRYRSDEDHRLSGRRREPQGRELRGPRGGVG